MSTVSEKSNPDKSGFSRLPHIPKHWYKVVGFPCSFGIVVSKVQLKNVLYKSKK